MKDFRRDVVCYIWDNLCESVYSEKGHIMWNVLENIYTIISSMKC